MAAILLSLRRYQGTWCRVLADRISDPQSLTLCGFNIISHLSLIGLVMSSISTLASCNAAGRGATTHVRAGRAQARNSAEYRVATCIPAKSRWQPVFVRSFEIEADDEFESIIRGAVAGARDASKRNAVFSPPVASFRDVGKAGEADLVEGFTISVECDAFPQTALAKLVKVIDSPTLVVASGGQWTDPKTGEVQDKLHLHWVLMRASI